MQDNMVETEILSATTASAESNILNQILPAKKKRNLPGMPDPDADVIALSPKTLLATNRFVCEICKKGFQRDQNLQLHRRGHNMPWKLRQRSGQEPRKRVYVCPEPSCVHHEPSRALGDLTGIKKHFCRKHFEKKFKCERCPRKYAVLSDCKAHMKTCGSREYRCDCGTLFSRRDSFITHRAFCDALAREKARSPPVLPNVVGGDLMVAPPASPPLTPSATVLSPVLSIQSSATVEVAENSNAELQPPPPPATTTVATASDNVPSSGGFLTSMLSSSQQPSWYPMAAIDPVSLSLNRQFHYVSRLQPPALSATALLQKATQMGATSSDSSFLRGLGLALPSSSTMKLESSSLGSSSTNLNELMMFGNKPVTLDLLGLGMGGGEASSGGFSAFLSSFGGAAGDAWDDTSHNENKYSYSKHDF